jgi:hypothetical protein
MDPPTLPLPVLPRRTTHGRRRLSSRDISSGSLNWRRNVCSEGGDKGGAAAHAHAVAAHATSLATLDRAGVVRSWDLATGTFSWETSVQQGSNNKVSISMVLQVEMMKEINRM